MREILIAATLLSFLPAAAARGAEELVVNEILFAPNSGALDPGLRFEFVELFNPGTNAVQLAGWTLEDSSGLLYIFPTLALPARGFVVVYGSGADGVLSEDTDASDGSALLVATSTEWPSSGDLANGGDAIQLYDPISSIRDFVFYDESNEGDNVVDLAAVAAGIWKSGAAIDTLPSGTSVGRAIALAIDGAAPNQVGPVMDAEDLDWLQYDASAGGTPGFSNDLNLVFRDGFESGGQGAWSESVGA